MKKVLLTVLALASINSAYAGTRSAESGMIRIGEHNNNNCIFQASVQNEVVFNRQAPQTPQPQSGGVIVEEKTH